MEDVLIDAAQPTGPGRPRDPELEDRVFDAVLDIYAEDGWTGLTFAAVARRATVGKSSLYLRWDSKAEMLVDALRLRPPIFETVDSGSTRTDLIVLVEEVLRYFTQSAGLAGMRLFVDAQFHPELSTALLNNLYTEAAVRARTVIERGIARNELDPSISVSVVLYALFGGAQNHLLSNPRRAAKADRRVLENLVDLLLHGALPKASDCTPRSRPKAGRPVRK